MKRGMDVRKNINKILLVFICIFIISGCQKTPDAPIVRGKNIDNIVEKAVENPVVVDKSQGDDLKKPLDAPEKFIMETVSTKGNLKIIADADIVVPNADSMPVARVSKAEFSEKDVENLFKVFGEDAIVIDPNSLYTSEYYLNEVKRLRDELRDEKEGYKQKSDEDKDSKELKDELGTDHSENYIESEIEKLLNLAAEAPDDYKEIEPDFSFNEADDSPVRQYDYEGTYARLVFKGKTQTISEIIVWEEQPYSSSKYAEYYRDNSKTVEVNRLETQHYLQDQEGQEELPKISIEEAQNIADLTISGLELYDFVCAGSRIARTSESFEGSEETSDGKSYYEFMYTRMIKGVPINFTDDEGLTTVHDAYHEPWMYERIRIFIDEEGVFYLKWASPYELTEIVSEASSLLAFSEIAGIAKNMLPIKYDYWDNDERYSYELKITEARLGLMRVTEMDVGDTGLIIPVWDFFGELTIIPKSEEFWEGKDYYNYSSLITINAIDGTIIDRELGY